MITLEKLLKLPRHQRLRKIEKILTLNSEGRWSPPKALLEVNEIR